MQMIWLMEASVPAKKVHFNLNGSELRGFHIKARSGKSSILYADPLAPKAVACFCLCPAVFTGGPMSPQQLSVKVPDSDSTFWPISIPVVCTGVLHTFPLMLLHTSPSPLWAVDFLYLSYKTSIYISVSSTIQWVSHDSMCTQ